MLNPCLWHKTGFPALWWYESGLPLTCNVGCHRHFAVFVCFSRFERLVCHIHPFGFTLDMLDVTSLRRIWIYFYQLLLFLDRVGEGCLFLHHRHVDLNPVRHDLLSFLRFDAFWCETVLIDEVHHSCRSRKSNRILIFNQGKKNWGSQREISLPILQGRP